MKTTDVYLAATLLALGHKLETVDRKDPRHMQFHFSPKMSGTLGEIETDAMDKVETEWANRTLMVNAFDQAEAIKRMKSIIHSS